MYNTFVIIKQYFSTNGKFNPLLHASMKFMLLRMKSAIVREASGHPRNRTPMGMSISALAHLVMKTHDTELIVRLKSELLLLGQDESLP